jgi:2-iminobutanoate/2-iminopropanoate deaminase
MMSGMKTPVLAMAITIAFALPGLAQKQAVRPAGASVNLPFSPGIIAGGTLYVAGQVGSDPDTGKIPEVFEDEVKQTLENAGRIMKEAGYSFADAVTVQVYLTDMDLFPRMNKVYTGFFPDPKPARTTVGISKLVGTAKIEITITAWKPEKK